MSSRSRLAELDQSGAADQDVATWDAALGMWIAQAGGGGGGGGGGSGLLAVTSYNPTTVVTVTSQATANPLDSTNLAATFTVPASGRVILVLTCAAYTSGAGQTQYWQVRASGTLVPGSEAPIVAHGSSWLQRGMHRCLITGLSAGATVTWVWHARSRTGVNVYTRFGDDGTDNAGGPAVMEVWEA